ncbi:MAG: DsrE family protein [Chloroflexi bacterium]|nr:DsrE family protein [Chloroflexota bacterium]
MKLGIVLNSKDPETAWNALRLGITALETGHKVTVFLIGNGVEIESINDERFNVRELLQHFAKSKKSLLACGTCMTLRKQEAAGVLLKSSMAELLQLVNDSDKVVTFG